MALLEDYFGFTFETFTHRPTRSWLTILGILIGIAAVVSLISVGQGLQDSITRQFEAFGTDKVLIMQGGGQYGAAAGFVGNERLDDHDVSVVERTKGVEKAIGIEATYAKVTYGSEPKYGHVFAFPLDKFMITDFPSVTVAEGREPKPSDNFKAVIGYEIAHGNFFKKEVKVGDTIKIADTEFEVIATLTKIGNKADDSQIYISLDSAKATLGDLGYSVIYGIVKNGFDTDDVAGYIKDRMRRDRNEKAGSEDFTVTTTAQLSALVGNIIGVVQTIVIGIASISLVVGGVGIMNTMYTSVMERTREIGVMKAIGAKNSDILLIFLIESGLIGLVGGIIGVLLGVGFGSLVGLVTQQGGVSFGVSFPPWLTLGALAFSFVVGSLSGALPALSAARMKPADALRYE
ncbi:MacB-like periplasmic core domain protein [uncultured archaeon]|nr:MacB-like periplasmic core domain protein [uncultured archaeon]